MTAEGAVLVLGGTGRQGGATARHLLDRGRHVHALVRDPTEPAAAALVGLGAELVQGDLDDPASLGAAMAGVDGVFCVLPYQPGQPDREVAQASPSPTRPPRPGSPGWSTARPPGPTGASASPRPTANGPSNSTWPPSGCR
jgi:NmrA-like family protein